MSNSTSSESSAWLPTVKEIDLEICRQSPVYFLTTFVLIERKSEKEELAGEWLPFLLWPAQQTIIGELHTHRMFVMLKARQLGFSWIVLGYILWLVLFRPIATVLIFSKRDDEAVALLRMRLKEMHRRLPGWMIDRCNAAAGMPDQAHHWSLANGSRVMALPTTGGRSYTGTFVLVDEADWVPDLKALLNAVKPTVDAGGQLVLLSSPDKSEPESIFKNIFRAAQAGKNSYRPIFYGWNARPDRTQEWYDRESAEQMENHGTLDELWQEYPQTIQQALSPRTLEKRIAPAWLEKCYREAKAAVVPFGYAPRPPAIPGLVIYAIPHHGGQYVVGIDPAEGNPTSDDSALTVLDTKTGEEVACLAGKLQPAVIASYADQIGTWYNNAAIMCERNNHGHAVIGWLEEHSRLTLLCGHDGKVGWMSSTLGKTKLYDAAADAFRNGEVILHSFATFTQLASIEGSTLRAPEGQRDDKADGFALACVGRIKIGDSVGADMPMDKMSLGSRGPQPMRFR